jgi:type I restriction enzyme, S subunit
LDDGDTPGITSPDYVVFKSKKGIIHPRWFYYWFRSPYGENFIKTLARGAVRERMLFNRLGRGEVDLPSWEIQSQIAEKLKDIKALKVSVENQLSEINRLPSALLHLAFTVDM